MVANPLEFRFKSVSGIGVHFETQQVVWDRGEKAALNGKSSTPTLRLERGYVVGSSPIRREIEILMYSEEKFVKRKAHIMLLNEQSVAVATWLFHGVALQSWQLSDLDANSNDFLIETMELSYDKFQSISL